MVQIHKKRQQSGVDKGSSDAADQEVVCDQEVRLLDQSSMSPGMNFRDGLQKQSDDHEIE